MESTFITIHDISLDARLLYVSQSIEDILGYRPTEVVGKSCWEYFHPDEIPFAQAIHGRSIQLDKAANLNYCKIKNKQGKWVSCECVFTVVHDVLIGCTSIYRHGPKSQKRARDAPVIRQLFSSSPRDPRYHMLQYISSKFTQRVQPNLHEPRAALFLNRFSRTLTIMYATNGLSDLLGIDNTQLLGKSFYYCIQENCLREGVKCLESAKANDSIAYLRFWFRDPRQDELRADGDERMSDMNSSGDDDEGGVHLSELMDHEGSEHAVATGSSTPMRSPVEREPQNGNGRSPGPNSRSSSGNSTDLDGNGQDGLFDRPENQQSRTSSVSTPDEPRSNGHSSSQDSPQIELEAVVSCTSDGLVVILRRARPLVPPLVYPYSDVAESPYPNGLFASPWASQPIFPDLNRQTRPPVQVLQQPNATANPPSAQAPNGPTTEAFMNTIREVAVFAWALTGINGSLAQYSKGEACGEAQPPRLQVWDPRSDAGIEQAWCHEPQPTGPPMYKAPNKEATADATIPRTCYSYLTGLPEQNLYSGSEPMQIDSETNCSSMKGSTYGSQVGHPQQNSYGDNHVGQRYWNNPSYPQ